MAKEEKNKLLIVEDDKGLQKQLKWCFEDYELSFADDRESAIAQLRRNEPAVVLQDLGLPPDAEGVSEGIAALEEILVPLSDEQYQRGAVADPLSRHDSNGLTDPVEENQRVS